MIETVGNIGYAAWLLLGLATVAVALYKTQVEGNPTSDENKRIMESVAHRSNSFLTTDRTVSKWGTE